MGKPRHGRWLHARISGDLEDAIKREARRRRLPVSMLVRDVLEGAFDLVEELVDEGLEVARRSQRLARRVAGQRSEPADADIYGWQDLILNRGTVCGGCRAVLPAGVGAYRGLSERPGSPIFQCADCIGRLRPANAEENSR